MNIAQAKAIPIAEILERYGQRPTARKGAELWYLSPFRKETVPSFVVNTVKNVWYDHGEGVGGTGIDLVSRMAGEPNIGRVLRIVAELVRGIVLPTPAVPTPKTTKTDSPTVVSATDIEHPALIRYLATRAIPLSVADKYLREVRYEVGQRAYFGLGFANNANGYEIRSERFKGCVGSKDMTVFPDRDSSVVNVFEGFMDFLSWLVLEKRERLEGTTIVLNSVSLADRVSRVIEKIEDAEVRCFLDNDDAGRKTLGRLKTTLPNVHVVDMSDRYRESQDVNAELQRVNRRKTEIGRELPSDTSRDRQP